MAEETVKVTTEGTVASAGSANLQTQVNGSPATVSAAAQATGGVGAGKFIETDIDDELFKFRSDDTPLMQMMLKAKRVVSKSPIMEHYAIDEERCQFETASALSATSDETALLPVSANDKTLAQAYDTIACLNVDGYDLSGNKTPGKFLMLFVTGKDKATGYPIVRAVNGPKASADDTYSTIPEIPSGTKCVVCANALYETQKEVAPDLIVPKASLIPLQKRGMNQVISDYFDSQKKRVPFTKAIIAEAAIAKFKRKGNRTFWISRAGHFQVETDKTGYQDVYTTEGVRWQFKKEMQHSGAWTYEEFIGLAKTYYTGEDVPNSGIVLCGKNFLENVQCIDFSKHPEVRIEVKTNYLGWEVTNIHTVFGDLQLKREPTLDKIGYSNSAAIIGENRLVHYVYTSEKSFEEDIDGEEAKRSGVIVWDGLALKGACHIFINCEGYDSDSSNTTIYKMWNSAEAPSTTAGTASAIYYLLVDCAGIAEDAKKGELWQYDGKAWKEIESIVNAE